MLLGLGSTLTWKKMLRHYACLDYDSPVAPTLEHRGSVKRFVSLLFLNPKTVCRTPWTGDQPVARPLINASIHDLSGIRTHYSNVRASEDS
jgi:hypothetical protein